MSCTFKLSNLLNDARIYAYTGSEGMQPCRWLPTSRRDPSPPASTLKTVVKLFSETVTTYKTVRCHNGEDHGCTNELALYGIWKRVRNLSPHTLSELKHFKFQIRINFTLIERHLTWCTKACCFPRPRRRGIEVIRLNLVIVCVGSQQR
jgi:hypothetical protein